MTHTFLKWTPIFILAIALSFIANPASAHSGESDAAHGDYCNDLCEIFDLKYGEYHLHDSLYVWTRKTYENNEEFYDKTFGDSLAGRVLLQVEEHGEAYYVHPDDSIAYYLKDGAAAYDLMRLESLGISEADFVKLDVTDDPQTARDNGSVCATNSFANNLRGRVMLRAEAHGEAYYIDPETCRAVYIKDGNVAYNTMRYLSLGISNANLDRIPTQKLVDVYDSDYATILEAYLIDVAWECDESEFTDMGNEQKIWCRRDTDSFRFLNDVPTENIGLTHFDYSLTTNYDENTITIELEDYIYICEEEINGTYYTDVPYVLNQACLSRAYQNALTNFELNGEIPEEPQETSYYLHLQDNKEIPTVYMKDTYIDQNGTKIVSCTYPLIDHAMTEKYGKSILETDVYNELIEFEPYAEYDPSETGGFILGDLTSGDPDKIEMFNDWHVGRILEGVAFPYAEVPPWIDAENQVYSFYDRYYERILTD